VGPGWTEGRKKALGERELSLLVGRKRDLVEKRGVNLSRQEFPGGRK